MVRLTGFVIVEGRKVSLDWTVIDGGIVNAGSLSPSNIVVHAETPHLPPPPPPVEAPPLPETPLDYNSMNKTELMTLCSQRGLSTTGTKAELIARLEADDAGAAEAVDDGENDAESEPK